MNELYPLRFYPIIKEIIWGGNKLKKVLNKETGNIQKAAESWEISAYENNISVVSNGYLAENNLKEIIEVYMEDIVGDVIYNKFGTEFPLLIKFIDANDILSIQVHPDDNLAKKRHNANGKTEMWYIVQAEKGSTLISGFNKEINKKIYKEHFNNHTLPEILNYEEVSAGDVFFMPAGRVHAIGSGIMLAEIQQTSDLTYRIYDWDRTDKNGMERELHTDLAIDAIDYRHYDNYKTNYSIVTNQTQQLIHCDYFTTNLLRFDQRIEKDYAFLDSFVIYMCIDGAFSLDYVSGKMKVVKGETILLPAALKEFILIPDKETTILEIYLSKNSENIC